MQGLGKDWQLRETRHTAVSLLSDHGVPAERISDVMGHGDPTVTMRVYRHQLRPTVADAAQAMDEIFKPSATRRAKPNTP
jgi:integrase